MSKKNSPQMKDVSTYDVLRFQQEWSEKRLSVPYTYERFPGIPEKVVYRKMEKLERDGYLEYGVSLRTAWLTEKGLTYLSEYSDEEE